MLFDVTKAREVLKERRQKVFIHNYQWKDETIDDMFKRLARATSKHRDNPEETYNEFYEILSKGYFVPGGRIMRTIGRDDENGLPYNCYACPSPEDDLNSIYDIKKMLVKMQQKQGGVGFDITPIRPRGTPIKNSGGEASGVIVFMDSYQNDVKTVKTGVKGKERRGALLIALQVQHPDIREFIRVKRDTNLITNANISVLITDKFINAVRNNGKFDLEFGGKVYETVNARELWDEIIESNYLCGEPGIIFIDKLRKTSNTEYFQPITVCNACSEVLLPARKNEDGSYQIGCCNLGSLNIYQILKDNPKDADFYDEISRVTKIAVDFLDCVISEADIRLEELEKLESKDPLISNMMRSIRQTQLNSRRIGLGTMGVYSAMITRGIQYGSKESLDFIDKIWKNVFISSYMKSKELGELYNSFNMYCKEEFKKTFAYQKIKDYFNEKGSPVPEFVYLRNSNLTSGPPSGNTSVFAMCSSSIEPVYDVIMKRKDSVGEHVIVDPAIIDLVEENPGLQDFPYYCVSAMDIPLEKQMAVLDKMVYWVDTNVSKTVNAKKETPIEEIRKCFDSMIDGKFENIRSITFYRDGTRANVISSAREKNRPVVLNGMTFKKRFKQNPKSKYHGDSYFITINSDAEKMPYECLTTCRNNDILNKKLLTTSISVHHALKNMTSTDAILDMTQQFGEVSIKEEKHLDTVSGKSYNSLLHVFADIIEEYLEKNGLIEEAKMTCPVCGKRTLSKEKKGTECQMCPNCFYSPCSV